MNVQYTNLRDMRYNILNGTSGYYGNFDQHVLTVVDEREMERKMEREMKREMEQKIKKELEQKIKKELGTKMKRQMEKKIKKELKQKMERDIEQKINKELEHTFDITDSDIDELCDDETTQCAICMSNMIKIRTIPCGHGICFTCAKQIFDNKKRSCAFCRGQVTSLLKVY